MAQKILLRRGPIANLSGAATQQGELLLVTGSLGNLNGPFITMTGTSGTNTSTLVGKIYSGATAPTLTANESALTGTPFYSTTDQVLYILDHNGNVNMDITGNLENRSVSNFDITTLTGGTATFSGDVSAANLTLSGNATIDGNITLGGNINIGDADTDTITFGGEVTSHIVPDVDSTYDLGSTTKRWANIYVDALTGDTIDLSSNASIGGTLGVTGATTLSSTLAVTGASTLSSTLNVVGAVDLDSTLNVDGNSTLGGTLSVTGGTTLSSTLGVTGATNLQSTLDVTGATTLEDTVNIQGAATLDSTLGVTGAATLSSTLNVVGAVDLDSTLNVDGNSTLGGTLSVTGAATLNSSLDVTGVTTLDDTLDVNASATISGDITLDGAGAQTITNSAGNLTITSTAGDVFVEGTQFQGDNVIIPGDLTVSGTTTTINSTEVNIGDNIITLNAAGTVADGGVQVIDTTGTAGTGSILWNATNDYWYAGVSGSTHFRIATYTNATPASDALPKVDANKRLVASNVTDNGSLVTVGTALTATGRVTLTDAGNTSVAGSELVYRATNNEVGYLSLTPTTDELNGVVGVNTAGDLVVSSVVDGGTF